MQKQTTPPDEAYRFWHTKWQLSLSGQANSIDDIKINMQQYMVKDHVLFACNYATLLKESKLYQIEKEQTYGRYQTYDSVPVFLVLEGHLQMQCINLEGDNDIVATVNKAGVLQVNQAELKNKYGETNLPLLTQFQITGVERSIVVELNAQSLALCRKTTEVGKVSTRQEMIMRKYMLIALQHITKITYCKDMALTQRFYLLEGRACFYHVKNKTIISCYEEGIFNPKDIEGEQIRLYLFQGAYLMLLEGQMLKDQVVQGVQIKRKEHLAAVLKKYEGISVEEREKVQNRVISKYGLNKGVVEREIYKIERIEKRLKSKNDMNGASSKNDMIHTSSSIKEKCGIRIRKTRKVI